jgi:hypothetical protein
VVPGFTQSVFMDKDTVTTYNFDGFLNDAQIWLLRPELLELLEARNLT